MMQIGLSKGDFEKWKLNWFMRVPKCFNFMCCHELTSCCVDYLCGCGSIYETYKNQECPLECFEVDCDDCMNKYECENVKRIVT